jgi:hypothetical protein
MLIQARIEPRLASALVPRIAASRMRLTHPRQPVSASGEKMAGGAAVYHRAAHDNSALPVGLPGQPMERLPPDAQALQGAILRAMAGGASGEK